IAQNLRFDLRFALRVFRRNPAFSVAAVLSVAIGVGATVAVFSVVNALLLKPLPYQDPDRLVILWNTSPGLNITQDWFSTAQYFDIKNGHHGLEQVALAIGGNENLTGTGDPERVGTIHVTANLLAMLGVQPHLGRLLQPWEDDPGHAATAVLSYGMWTRRFNADPRVLGKSITLNGKNYEVVGVLPRSFTLPREVLPTLGGAEQSDILIPLVLGPGSATMRDHEDYNIIGKLRPGVSIAQARAEMDTITATLRRDHPDLYPPNGGLTFAIVPLLEQVVGDTRRPLMILLGAAGFVLLIACANLANLWLSRALARRQEIALRTALGANRARVVRQLITECALLGVIGGALGTLFAASAVAVFRSLRPVNVPRVQDIAIDGRVLAFSLLLSLLAGLLFGIVPALRSSRVDLVSALKGGSRTASETGSLWGRGGKLRKLLLVSEVALAVVLLVGAGLLTRSFAALLVVNPGFNADRVLTLGLTMTGRQYTDRQHVVATYRQLWDRLDHIPGVTASGGITSLPLSEMYAWGPITVEGQPLPPGENFINADQRIVAGQYFTAMQIPLLRGRLFTENDNAATPRVVIIDDSMAAQFWPHQDPLGKRIRLGSLTSNAPVLTVVGVVGRIKQYTLDSDSRIALYIPHLQYPTRDLNIVVRSAGAPSSIAGAVTRAVHDLDPNLPVYAVRSMQQRVADSLARRRFAMGLLAFFAVVSLTLAALGTFAVIATLVNQGLPEIGIRIALGATRLHILNMIMIRAMLLAACGVASGLVTAAILSRFMRSLLFGVLPHDPATYLVVSAVLVGVSLVATGIPAGRAARTDPMTSLRSE
ncbi:MAG TPA: ABC transporter permease, partial [Acidobacteriaceae bacterium]|nr:ABC transporter permease [Acidobacteriaceae bacterium]